MKSESSVRHRVSIAHAQGVRQAQEFKTTICATITAALRMGMLTPDASSGSQKPPTCWQQIDCTDRRINKSRGAVFLVLGRATLGSVAICLSFPKGLRLETLDSGWALGTLAAWRLGCRRASQHQLLIITLLWEYWPEYWQFTYSV